MKKTAGFCMLAVALFTVAWGASARDTVHYLPIKAVIEKGKAEGKLDGSVQFYFNEQKHPAVQSLVPDVVSNKKTNGANKGDEAACEIAALSALIAFQERTQREGGNAVVNMISFYKKKPYQSNDLYECHAGTFVVGVALKGDVVKLKGK